MSYLCLFHLQYVGEGLGGVGVRRCGCLVAGWGFVGKNRESSQRMLRTTLLNQVTMPVIGKLVIETITSFSLARGKEGANLCDSKVFTTLCTPLICAEFI